MIETRWSGRFDMCEMDRTCICSYIYFGSKYSEREKFHSTLYCIYIVIRSFQQNSTSPHGTKHTQYCFHIIVCCMEAQEMELQFNNFISKVYEMNWGWVVEQWLSCSKTRSKKNFYEVRMSILTDSLKKILKSIR